MTNIEHPLPVGTRVYYEDLDGGEGTITHNDNTTATFASAVDTFNDEVTGAAVVAADVDYIIQFDDFEGPTPVQRSGILLSWK
jgi:hypothetical protein